MGTINRIRRYWPFIIKSPLNLFRLVFQGRIVVEIADDIMKDIINDSRGS